MTTILEDAQEAIFGARNVSYGHPRDNFGHTAKLWSAHKGVEFSAQDVAEFMVLVKLSRLQNGYHRDSVVDIAGYAGTIERLQEPVEELATPHYVYQVDGRTYYARWEDVPEDQAVNSSDESDNASPWHGDGAWDRQDGEYGEPPWRDWIDPDVTVEVVPGVWNYLRRVPVGTVVTDKDGDNWKRVRNGVHLLDLHDHQGSGWGEMMSLATADQHDIFAPFTEVSE